MRIVLRLLPCLIIALQQTVVTAFTILHTVTKQHNTPSIHKKQQHQHQYPSQQERRSSKTKLNYGVLVNVPDNFFTETGILLGVAFTLSRSINRVVVENIAWENRLEDARQQKLEDVSNNTNEGSSSYGTKVNMYTELDLRRQDAAVSKSGYGPDAMMERRGRRRSRTMTRDYDDEEEEEDESSASSTNSRTYSMTDEQIDQFESEFGTTYDPYYDEPYTEAELPDEGVKFVEDKLYGDRRYENGEVFYRDEENKNLYWRQGGRPRLKQFWEMF